MKTFHVSNISGMKLAINCETQQTAKKVLEAIETSKCFNTLPKDWTQSTPVLMLWDGEWLFQTFYFAKERNYRIITDAIFLSDNEAHKVSMENVIKVLPGIDWNLLSKQKLLLVDLAMKPQGRKLKPADIKLLDGLINLFDEFQDAAEKDKTLSDWTQIDTTPE